MNTNLVSACVGEWLAYHQTYFLFFLGMNLKYISQPLHSQGWHMTEMTATETEGLVHENLLCKISTMLFLHRLG